MKIGDVVYADGASGILGDVVDVEKVDGEDAVVHVLWRPTLTAELADDLNVVDDPPEQPLVKTYRGSSRVVVCPETLVHEDGWPLRAWRSNDVDAAVAS